MDQKKLAMPVMSRKRYESFLSSSSLPHRNMDWSSIWRWIIHFIRSLRADYQYTATNTIDVETGKSDVDENEERTKKPTTMRSLFTLIRRSIRILRLLMEDHAWITKSQISCWLLLPIRCHSSHNPSFSLHSTYLFRSCWYARGYYSSVVQLKLFISDLHSE